MNSTHPFLIPNTPYVIFVLGVLKVLCAGIKLFFFIGASAIKSWEILRILRYWFLQIFLVKGKTPQRVNGRIWANSTRINNHALIYPDNRNRLALILNQKKLGVNFILSKIGRIIRFFLSAGSGCSLRSDPDQLQPLRIRIWILLVRIQINSNPQGSRHFIFSKKMEGGVKARTTKKKELFLKLEKNVAIKLERGGGQALVAGPQKNNFFCGFL